MKQLNMSLLKKCLVLLPIIILSILLIMSSNNVNEFVENKEYSHSKSINLSYNSTISKKRRLPQAILIGAMKCGTKALTSMMKMHSKFVAPENEINFFDKNYSRGLRWYQTQMPFSYEDQITFEKSPSYFKMRTPEIPTRIHSMNSSIRIILIVRDPVLRSISHFVHKFENGKYNNSSFEEKALGSGGLVNHTNHIISDSIYKRAFKMYLEVFSPEQILVLDGEQLILNPLPIVKKVEKFLNLGSEITRANLYFDKKKGFYCMKKDGKEKCLGDSKGRAHPKVDEDTLRKLREFFAPYNQRFYDLVGYDFGWATS